MNQFSAKRRVSPLQQHPAESKAAMRSPKRLLALSLALSLPFGLSACQTRDEAGVAAPAAEAIAPGAPGTPSTWAFSGKTGIGTAYEAYQNGQYQQNARTGEVSKVWFSLAQGIVTETMYGLIHEAQIKDMQFFIQGKDFLDEEKTDTVHQIDYLHKDNKGRPLSLAYKVISKDKEDKYSIEKHIFTDPDHQTLMMKVVFISDDPTITPYLALNPHAGNTGEGDRAWQDGQHWYAQDTTGTSLTLATDAQITDSTVGFVGRSDGISALKNGQPLPSYTSTGTTEGNVAITLAMPVNKSGRSEWVISLGFGKNPQDSRQAADQSLAAGYSATLAKYNGEGAAIGWEDYLHSLKELPSLAKHSNDDGKLLYSSALVLKAQEDKTHAGALIASLSNPWGDANRADTSKTGYKAVWPRDFYQVAMAMLALGDTESPKVAFSYLKKVQVSETTPGFTGTGGWFLQKTHVDGQLEWIAVQLDQTAMPIMLGWRLWQSGVLTDQQAIHWYQSMLKPAADFLTDGGKIKLDWSDINLVPPFTQQERWEEQSGYSPSSIAALIAGLVCAADLAKHAGDNDAAKRYLAAADRYSANLESSTFTRTGSYNKGQGPTQSNGQYYVRISQNQDPNDHAPLGQANGKIIRDETEILDAGFLELVRYGVRSANDSHIVESLPELDDTSRTHDLRVKYMFEFEGETGQYPGWRRYGLDGYGEDVDTGLAYGAEDGKMSAGQRGRVWPFFTGERAHYEFARGKLSKQDIQHTYVKALELFANEGLMLPEQVWDGVGKNHYNYVKGEGTNSATPLAWTHAEYIKLLRTLRDDKVWDRYTPVESRYAK